MKIAYVSLVVCDENYSSEDISNAAEILTSSCKAFEIIVLNNRAVFQGVSNLGSFPLSNLEFHGSAEFDKYIYPALGRAVGDFILLWNKPLKDFSQQLICLLLDSTNQGNEIVILEPSKMRFVERLKWSTLNRFSRTLNPVQPIVGILFSRRSLERFIENGQSGISSPELVLADLAYAREVLYENFISSYNTNLYKYINLLVKGTRLGSFVPIALSLASISLALLSSFYAILIFLIRGQTPEGWTTLMVVVGFTQACVLGMVGLIWARIDSFIRNSSNATDMTLFTDVEINNG